MIFVIHYVLFNAGLSAVLILLTLFLQTYTQASLTEIGALLMVLPFVSILVKPLFCALADRHQAHQLYLALSLLLMALGYGSLALAPFFEDFYSQHGRLVWYLDAVGIVVGFSAFGVAWSLGDALSVNAARVKNIPWGSYRVWGTVSWGLFGWLIGQVNEVPALPRYVPAFLVLVGSLLLEALLVALWPSDRFDMSAEQEVGPGQQKQVTASGGAGEQRTPSKEELELAEVGWPNASSLSGTLNGSARLNPRLMGAMANYLMEDIGGSIRSSLKRGQQQKRTALADILEQHQLGQQQQPQEKPLSFGSQQSSPSTAAPTATTKQHSPIAPLNRSLRSDSCSLTGSAQTHTAREPSTGTAATLGRAALRRTQHIFSRMNSLSSASGHAIADQLRDSFQNQESPLGLQQQQFGRRSQVMTMSSLASNASLSRAAAARALGFGPTYSGKDLSLVGELELANDSFSSCNLSACTAHNQTAAKSVEDLQLVLLKLIVRRDRNILKYLVLFTLFGVLFTIHSVYFFLHVEQLCRQKQFDFSSVTGALIAAQSVSEIFCFLVIVPYLLPRVGRLGAFLGSGLMFAARYAFYATYYAQLSPYSALATEVLHGFAYGIIYTLITDIATECVNQVDDYVPELVQRRLVPPQMDPNQLKLPLRATMQGVFSGAFDGLGNGIGALFAGIYLDSHKYTSLWLLCAYMSAAIVVLYPLAELRRFLGARNERPDQGEQEKAQKK